MNPLVSLSPQTNGLSQAPQLVISQGRQQGQAVTLLCYPFLIGRSLQCQLRILEPYVSRRHCMLEQEGEEIWLYDLDSQNGTKVNGARVSERTLLQPGDLIAVGSTLILFAPDHSTPSPAKPPESQNTLAGAEEETLPHSCCD